MKALNVGNDIIEISRVAKAAKNLRFLKRVYSENECALFSNKKKPYESMAANWAAKEAFAKALGTGVKGFSLNEVSCLRSSLGKPYFEFSGKALEIVTAENLDFDVSLSHTKDYAFAVVIAFKKEER